MKKLLLYSILFALLLPLPGKIFADNYKNSNKEISPQNYTGANIMIYPGSLLQVETDAYTHPVNKNIKIASAVTDFYEGGYTTGFYISTNNGLNWTGTNNIKNTAGATITTIGDENILINQNGTFIMTYCALSPTAGFALKVGVIFSTNNGANWSSTVYIPGVDSADKPISETDNVPGSPYLGRTYAAYDEMIQGGAETKGIYFSYSTNAGSVWSSSAQITNNDLNYRYRLICDMSVGANGEVFVLWYTNSHTFGVAKSTNGGVNWIQKNDNAFSSAYTTIIYEFNGINLNGVPSMKIDNSDGIRNGWIYTVNTGLSADSLDIILHRSTNGGISWDHSIRVNQDSPIFKKIQTTPAMNVDEFGGINIMYLDSRNSQLNDSLEVYLSRSSDGGVNFTDTKISDHKFKPAPTEIPLFGSKSYIGSYTGLISGAGKLTPVWYDNSAGHYQAFTTVIELLPTFEVKVFPAGFYDENLHKLRMKDTIKAYLRNSSSPYQIIDSSMNTVDSVNLKVSLKFGYDLSSGNYYLDIRHRNSIQTWSAAALIYSFGSIVNYDFTTDVSNAFGGNMSDVGGKWGIFSGDINQDGTIDAGDLSIVENDAASSLSGYVTTDVNGDDIVDAGDLSIVENNMTLGVSVITP